MFFLKTVLNVLGKIKYFSCAVLTWPESSLFFYGWGIIWSIITVRTIYKCSIGEKLIGNWVMDQDSFRALRIITLLFTFPHTLGSFSVSLILLKRSDSHICGLIAISLKYLQYNRYSVNYIVNIEYWPCMSRLKDVSKSLNLNPLFGYIGTGRKNSFKDK